MRTALHWAKIGQHAHHGIAVPLSALRTHKSCGIGEFLDLIPLIAFCHAAGLDCLQLFPLNDTGDDPSFFNPISSCALDPVYLSLHALDPEIERSDWEALNALPRLARSEVKTKKMHFLRSYFARAFPSIFRTQEYQDFVRSHPWLDDFSSFQAWKETCSTLPAYGTQAADPHAKQFYCFLQYLCFAQWNQVRNAAQKQRVFLKGDLPLSVRADSVDTWAHPHLFHPHLVAGAPPDQYNASGQKWGFPIYNWDRMKKEHFAWWKQRLGILEQLYHLYRIDHVVGFFRIWAIPKENDAAQGFFVPENTLLWEPQGKEILEMILSHCSLLPIAEDLGTIPDVVFSVLKEFGICGTKVIRWQRYKEGKQAFLPYQEYEPLSMTTVSNADIEPLALWWKKFPEDAAAFARFKHWQYTPELSRHRLFEILHDSHHTPSYFHINPLQEYLSLFPELTWPNLEEERINIPGTLLPTNWSYRLRPYLEDLQQHSSLLQTIRSLCYN